MENRIKILFKNFKLESGDAFFVSDESNVTYLTGFTGEAAYAIISPSGSVLMTDGRYDQQASAECHKDIIVTKWLNPTRPDPKTIAFYLEKFKIKRLMFNDKSLSFRNYDNFKKNFETSNLDIELWPISGEIEKLREIKNLEEIALIRKACEIADKALELTLDSVKVGVTELQVVATLEYNLKMCGADNISFDTMVLSGNKTALPHGKPSNKKLEDGDFLQFDFGALYKGYHSDMSRTFFVGSVSEKQKKLYEMMLKATVDATDVLKDGITAKYPDDIVRNIISDEYLEYYYPGLGHGVGLDIHEAPSMSATTKDNIKENMIVTIEPGVYVPNWGGMRIEDTILVTKNAYEVLTKFPRELRILR